MKEYPLFPAFSLWRASTSASASQLTLKVAGSSAKMRGERRVSPTSRNQDKLCSEVPGWKVLLARPQGSGEGGREADLFIFTMDLLFSGIRRKKGRHRRPGRVGGRCDASLPRATPRMNESRGNCTLMSSMWGLGGGRRYKHWGGASAEGVTSEEAQVRDR